LAKIKGKKSSFNPAFKEDHYLFRPLTVLKKLFGAHLPIFTAIIIYIGLIVSDPATSPFYAIENVLMYVGHKYILLTMIIVLVVAFSVAIGYIAIGFRFNKGEGGTGLVFEWLGSKAAMVAGASLLTDFVLTDSVTMAACVAALVSFGVPINRFVLAIIVFLLVGILLRFGDKGRTVFAILSYGFIITILITAFLPIVPNAPEVVHSFNTHSQVPDHSNLKGLALITILLFGVVRGFALLTGLEAGLSALSHEEEKPKYARIAMGVGTIITVLIFTTIITINIAQIAQIFKLQPDHSNTLFAMWTALKTNNSFLLAVLAFFSTGILLSGSASGATAGGGLVHVLVRTKILPKSFTHVDKEHNDYKAMLIVHSIAFAIVLLFAVDEQKIVAFYAISVLIEFFLSLLASIKYAIKTKTYYLLLSIPGFLMVCFALVLNFFRYEGLVIVGIVFVLSQILHKRWIIGGKNKINFSH
jgi:hypothetical protein